MKNINMTIIDNKLIITIDLTQDHGKSASGKTNIVGSTEGWSKLPGDKHPEFSIGINCIKK